RLIRNRLFRPYLRYLDGSTPMPLRARLAALAVMWLAVATSLALLSARGALVPWIAGSIVAAAMVGSGVIVCIRRDVS
ncbi:MAG: hypothetical protein OEQ13_14760, partial [Acidobacteriota bacterium]|nr:hypothetical protein [Acidobacteriota bacterium]